MGIVFGRTGVEEPSFKLLMKCNNFELRQVQSYFIASVKMSEAEKRSGQGGESFPILAKYIGVFGTPQNVDERALAMTAPVLSTPSRKLAMTSPVLSREDMEMSFVLPFDLQEERDVPKPKDKRITITKVPSKILAVCEFSGAAPSPETQKEKLTTLVSNLKADNFISEGDENSINWELAQYHPPFTLPFLRRNEIWVELKPNNSKVTTLVAEAKATAEAANTLVAEAKATAEAAKK